MRQVKLQDCCEEIIDDVEGALGCAVVDIATGLPLALDVKPGSFLDAAAMELMSAAGVTYFSGTAMQPKGSAAERQADEATRDTRDTRDYVQEIQATTEVTYNFMSLVPGDEQELLILITDRRRSNLGLGWMAMRQALELVRKATDTSESEDSEPDAPAPEASDLVPPVPRQPNPAYTRPRAGGRRTIWGQR